MKVAPPAIAISLALALATCRRPEAAPVFPQAPVVLVSIDTLRSDRLPAYGATRVATPHIDRLRRDALLFSHAYSPCPMTLPAHVTMLTGLLPPEHGVRNNVGYAFDGSRHAHLPGLLKARGYATGAAVSSYVLRGDTGLRGLFDFYEDSTDPRSGTGFADQQRPGGVTLGFATRWLEAHAAGPFFLFLHIYEPHAPYEPLEPFRSRYADPYDGEIAAADAIVGELFERLRRSGAYDRAIVILTSDHGEGFSDHGEDQHGILLYREALQVPLLLKLPGSRFAGRTVDAPAQLADIPPTVTDLLGLEGPQSLRGQSLVSLALGALPARSIYAETLYPRIHLGWSELRSLVDGRYHYVHGPRPELYDLVSDPAERRDLIGGERDRAARMKADLEGYASGPSALGVVDPTVAERLAGLGYVGAPRERRENGPLPNPVDALPQLAGLREGFHLAATRRYDEAAATLTTVVERSPEMLEAWIKLGDVLLEGGRALEAVAAFEQALACSSVPMGDVLVSLGHARLRAGQLAAADKAAQQALASVPSKAHELLARVALASNRFDDAERHARDAATGGTQPSSLLVAAEVRTRRGDLQGALQTLEAARKRATELGLPGVYNLEALRGDALARGGRAKEAEQAYRAEIQGFPGNILAYANLAALLFAESRRAEVEPLLEEMLRANPNARARKTAVAALEAFGERATAARWKRRMQ